MDLRIADDGYVHLVLAVGQHDPDYVDAFYGPVEWKTQAEKEKKSLDEIGSEAKKLMDHRTLAGRALVDSGSAGCGNWGRASILDRMKKVRGCI
jgi:hypothetical protein